MTEVEDEIGGTLSSHEGRTYYILRFGESVAERSPSMETEQNEIEGWWKRYGSVAERSPSVEA